jgi:hypothetical protein
MSEQKIKRKHANANLITPPSLFLYESGPKILLMGSGAEWKQKFIDFSIQNWVFDPISIYYYLDNSCEELTNWIWYNGLNADIILYHFNEESGITKRDLFLLGIHANMEKCFLSIDPKVHQQYYEIGLLFRQVNKNQIKDMPHEHVSEMKKLYNK